LIVRSKPLMSRNSPVGSLSAARAISWCEGPVSTAYWTPVRMSPNPLVSEDCRNDPPWAMSYERWMSRGTPTRTEARELTPYDRSHWR
jgi:hypothetical protein